MNQKNQLEHHVVTSCLDVILMSSAFLGESNIAATRVATYTRDTKNMASKSFRFLGVITDGAFITSLCTLDGVFIRLNGLH